MRSDVGTAMAVDKGHAQRALPTESSRVAETCDLDAVRPTDIADTCSRPIDSGKSTERMTGGSSENAAVAAGRSTDKNAFPEYAARSTMPRSRKLRSGSDTHEKRRLLGAINQDGGHERKAIEGNDGVPASSSASASRPERPRRRLDRKRSKEISREMLREKSAKRRVNAIILTDADFVGAKADSDDFSEFEKVEERNQRVPKKGVLVSELSFKPRADIGGLDRVTTEEFCPLTLEDVASCGETTT